MGWLLILTPISVALFMLSPIAKQLMRLEMGLSLRDALWKAAWKMLIRSPIWGNGPLSFDQYKFYDVEPGLAKDIASTAFGGAAHNLLLTKAAELGIFGVLIIIAIWVYIVYVFIKNIKMLRNMSYGYIYIAAGAIYIGLISRSFFEIGNMIGNGRINENIFPLFITALIVEMPNWTNKCQHWLHK